MALGQRFTSLTDGSSNSGSFSTKPSAGHCIVVCISGRAYTGEFSSSGVTDSAGNTYVLRASKRTTGLVTAAEIWVAENVAVPSGTWTVTAAHVGATSVMSVASFDNVATSSSFDQSATASGNNTNTLAVGPTGTLAQANELVVGCMATYIASANIGVTTPSGYSEIGVYQDSGNYVGHQSCYKDVAATTAVSATWTWTTNTFYAVDGALLTLKTVGAGGGDGSSVTVSGSDTLPTAASGTSVPGAPTLVSASVETSSTIRVTWTAATGTVSGYRVYATADGGARNVVATAASTSTTIVVGGLTPGVVYVLDVVAFNGAGEGTASSTLTRTTSTLIARISNLSASIAGTTVSVAVWRAPSGSDLVGEIVKQTTGVVAPSAVSGSVTIDVSITQSTTLPLSGGDSLRALLTNGVSSTGLVTDAVVVEV